MGSAGVGVGGQVGRIKDAPRCCFLASNPLESVLVLQSLLGEKKTEYIACLGPAVSPEAALPLVTVSFGLHCLPQPPPRRRSPEERPQTVMVFAQNTHF